MKWNALDLGIMEIGDGAECSNPNDCRSSKRIVFVMELFERYFLRQIVGDDGIQSVDIHYIEMAMNRLYDLNHIQGHKEEALPSIECDRGNGDEGQCIGEMMRKYRESERREDDDDGDSECDGLRQFVAGLNLRERNWLETTVRIHSLVCHSAHGQDGDAESDGD